MVAIRLSGGADAHAVGGWEIPGHGEVNLAAVGIDASTAAVVREGRSGRRSVSEVSHPYRSQACCSIRDRNSRRRVEAGWSWLAR
jgi:hypothetical protein